MKKMTCLYGIKKYTVKFDPKKSPYYGLNPSVMSLEYLPYYSTIDDPVIKDIARQLSEQIEIDDVFYKATVALTFVQQNIKYVSDESRFGRDVWELPIYTVTERVADCDGMANLYTSIAYNMGIDVITVVVTGHMLSAVCLRGHGKYYEHDGKKYYHMETTDKLPAAGRYWENPETYCMAEPLVPIDDFKSMLSDKI